MNEGIPLIANGVPKQTRRDRAHVLWRKMTRLWAACLDQEIDGIVCCLNPSGFGRRCIRADAGFEVRDHLTQSVVLSPC